MAYDSAAAISSSTPAAMPQTLYLDEKWKLSKKERTRSCSRPSIPVSPNSSSSSNPNIRRCALTRKCARLVKEQRARFYIMRRCVAMLICWRDYADA